MSKEITVKESYSPVKIKDMTAMANVLKQHVVKHNLFTPISGKNYVHVDGWAYAGGLMGLFPKVTKVENLSTGTELKWKADVEIVNAKGEVMGVGFALCSNKENKKTKFDEYSILSMAQTRAIGKGYRNLIGWVMKLSGYESTPSEEMTKMGEQPKEQVVVKTESQVVEKKPGQVKGPDGEWTYVCEKCKDPISESGASVSLKVTGKRLCKEHFDEIKNKKK